LALERDGNGLTRHQQHIIAHVVGCELLGLAHLKDEVLLALDVPFIWTIAADGSMDLGSAEVIADRLGLDESETELLTDGSEGLREGILTEDEGLFATLPLLLRVTDVTCSVVDEHSAKLVIVCDHGNIIVNAEDGIAKAQIEFTT
jgi:hypothetical protein